MYLAKMTTAQAKEAFEKDPIIVIPVGSTEQHGTQGALERTLWYRPIWRIMWRM